jgi:hypothetical protein
MIRKFSGSGPAQDTGNNIPMLFEMLIAVSK